MVARWFDDPDGPMWEGLGSDFRDGWLGTFEPEEGDGDLAPLQAVADALEAPDDEVMDALSATVDLDAWTTYWAMEVLLGHWDGYASNSNNFHVYVDPDTGLVHFLPWGIDALFDSAEPFGSGAPTSVVANTALPKGMYNVEEGQDAYYDRLFTLLDTTWREDEILARADAMEALVEPVADPRGTAGVAAAVDDIRTFVTERREDIEAEVARRRPTIDGDLRSYPCLVDRGELSLRYSTTWGSYGTQDWWTYGTIEMTFVLDGASYPATPGGVVIGDADGVIGFIAMGQLEWGAIIALVATLPEDAVQAGTRFDMDWSQGTAYLYYDESGTGENWAIAAYLSDGPFIFDEAGTTWGATVAGSVDLRVLAGGG